MNKERYEFCTPVSYVDDAWLKYYDALWIESSNTRADDSKQNGLGYKYTSNPEWYYQKDTETDRYYVVVDKE